MVMQHLKEQGCWATAGMKRGTWEEKRSMGEGACGGHWAPWFQLFLGLVNDSCFEFLPSDIFSPVDFLLFEWLVRVRFLIHAGNSANQRNGLGVLALKSLFNGIKQQLPSY